MVEVTPQFNSQLKYGPHFGELSGKFYFTCCCTGLIPEVFAKRSGCLELKNNSIQIGFHQFCLIKPMCYSILIWKEKLANFTIKNELCSPSEFYN